MRLLAEAARLRDPWPSPTAALVNENVGAHPTKYLHPVKLYPEAKPHSHFSSIGTDESKVRMT